MKFTLCIKKKPANTYSLKIKSHLLRTKSHVNDRPMGFLDIYTIVLTASCFRISEVIRVYVRYLEYKKYTHLFDVWIIA